MASSAGGGEPDSPNVFIPSYASYNWIGSPSNYSLTTNEKTGGDSTVENLNKWFQPGDQAFIIVASAMVRSRAQAIQLEPALTC